MQAVASLGQPLGSSLLAVDEDNQVPDHESGLLQGRDRLQLAGPVGDDVVDHHHPVAGRKSPSIRRRVP